MFTTTPIGGSHDLSYWRGRVSYARPYLTCLDKVAAYHHSLGIDAQVIGTKNKIFTKTLAFPYTEPRKSTPTSQLQSRVPPEVLFVERCVEWVKEGTGRVAIVLPDGILGNPGAEYIRAWILENCQVLASVDLPVEAFLPQVGVQASLLFLRRKGREERDIERMNGAEDYPVFMAVAETVGHDRRGNAVYVRDADGAEIAKPQVRQVLRRRAERDIVAEITVREKELDDDLPKIGDAYRAFLQGGSTA